MKVMKVMKVVNIESDILKSMIHENDYKIFCLLNQEQLFVIVIYLNNKKSFYCII